jgi:hypothetical protein
MRVPGAGDWQLAAVHAYLDRGPIDGLYEIDAEHRIMASADPQASLDAVIAELDHAGR